jgi:hypothetical protein
MINKALEWAYDKALDPGRPGIAYRLALVAAGEGEACVSTSGLVGYDIAGGHALVVGMGGVMLDSEVDPPPAEYSTFSIMSLLSPIASEKLKWRRFSPGDQSSIVYWRFLEPNICTPNIHVVRPVEVGKVGEKASESSAQTGNTYQHLSDIRQGGC